MQDRYTGDIGDFAKYAFLNAVAGSALRLGVVWYLNADEETNTDGSRVSYEYLRSCDAASYDALVAVRNSKRCIQLIEKAGLLPQGILYHSRPLPSSGGRPVRLSQAGRIELRAAWHREASQNVRNVDLVFVDPDNGIAGSAVSPGNRRANKYVLPDELRDYLSNGQSVVVYHHQTTTATGMVLR
jgi:hypothetical protein